MMDKLLMDNITSKLKYIDQSYLESAPKVRFVGADAHIIGIVNQLKNRKVG